MPTRNARIAVENLLRLGCYSRFRAVSDMCIRSNCESGGRPTTKVLPDTQYNCVYPINPVSGFMMYSQQDMVYIAIDDRQGVGFFAVYTSFPYNIGSSLSTIDLYKGKINDLLKLEWKNTIGRAKRSLKISVLSPQRGNHAPDWFKLYLLQLVSGTSSYARSGSLL